MKARTLYYAVALLGVLFLASRGAKVMGQQPATNGPATVDMTLAKPEAEGFSPERLERLHALMQQAVDQKQLPGAVTLLARHGRVVDYRTYGMRDAASGAAMTRDTIFRAFSMTKPVTGVAMMLLYEQGKWLPSDPISKHIPEFAHLKVYKGVDAAGNMILEDPIHPPTMQELMTHTAGFVYGFFGNTPVDKEYLKSGLMQSKSLREFVDKLAKIPLAYQPGTQWVYSVSMDIQGYIVEKLSGQTLPDFMQEHIFKPLGMNDSGFFVPADKRSRFVTIYRSNEKGEVVPAPGFGGDYAADAVRRRGAGDDGGGLFSVCGDA
jgi:CubicO group peptidase (beta-lactamase class C family)